MGDAFAGDAELIRTITRVAPGTGLREGIERILRGRTGALIVLGYDDEMESLCDGGFHLDVEFAPTRLRELAKPYLKTQYGKYLARIADDAEAGHL